MKCGAHQYHHWSKCPANEVKCHNCGQIGHYSRCCKVMRVKEVQSEDNNENEENYLEEIIVDETEETDEPVYVNLCINNKMVRFKIDTGADVSVIDKILFDKLNIKFKKIA